MFEQLSIAFGVAVGGLLAGWATTLPVLRFKELRDKAPRDMVREAAGAERTPARPVVRHARCGACHHDCTVADIAPVVGWGRNCRACGTPQPNYALPLQAGTAIAAGITALTFTKFWGALPVLWLVVVVVALATVDARIWMLPKRIVWTGAGVGLALIAIASVAIGEPGRLINAAIGAVGAGLFFAIMWAIRPGDLGFGDVRLSVLLGMYLGWVDPRLVLYGILIGSLLGVVRGVISIARGAGNRIAFGPSLAAGALIALWCHHALIGA
ncbi:MAG: hypothetical protein ACKOYM_10235 [Actinomycetes bacterium]